MSKSFLLMFCIVTGLLVLACSRPAETNRNAVATVSGDPIGVAECDDFINAYENCVATKVPEASRAAMRTSMATLRADWKKAAEDPQTRPALAAACKAHRERTVVQMRAHGCTF